MRAARRRGNASGAPRRAGLLRERGFRLYWSAQSVSLVGDEINFLAIPLAAVLLLDAGATTMGWLTAAALLPSLLLSIPGGAWADRQTDRRRAMIIADIGRFADIASVPLAYVWGTLTMAHLYVTEFVVGALTVLFRVCNHHVYASVVATERYVDGNALLSGSRAAASVAGPSTGGAVVQALSAPFALLMDAMTYLVSAACLGRIRTREAPPAPHGEGGLTDGLRWVTTNRTPGLLLAGVAMLSLCHTFLMTLFVLYGTTKLGLTPGALGAVVAVFGIGGLAGAYAAPRVVRRIGIGPAIVAGFLWFSLPLLLVPLAQGPGPLVIAALAAAQLGAGCGLRDTEERGKLAHRQVCAPVRCHEQHAVFQRQTPRTPPSHRIRALPSQRGHQSAAAARAQPGEWSYPGRLGRRDHNCHSPSSSQGKIASP